MVSAEVPDREISGSILRAVPEMNGHSFRGSSPVTCTVKPGESDREMAVARLVSLCGKPVSVNTALTIVPLAGECWK